jgi:hypothetical protein
MDLEILSEQEIAPLQDSRRSTGSALTRLPDMHVSSSRITKAAAGIIVGGVSKMVAMDDLLFTGDSDDPMGDPHLGSVRGRVSIGAAPVRVGSDLLVLSAIQE